MIFYWTIIKLNWKKFERTQREGSLIEKNNSCRLVQIVKVTRVFKSEWKILFLNNLMIYVFKEIMFLG